MKWIAAIGESILLCLMASKSTNTNFIVVMSAIAIMFMICMATEEGKANKR